MAKRAAAGTLALAVCLSGGAALASSAQAATGFKFDTRVAGDDRYLTAVAASVKAFPTGSDSVVLVNGDRTVDGLTASYVAGLHGAPILYVNPDGKTISPETGAEITRLKATKAYIVGGTTVVSASLEAKLSSGGGTVVRYGGDDRFETAAKVAGSGATPSKVLVASGERFADALVVGPEAYQQHYPILLTSSKGVPDATAASLKTISAKDVKVIGGTAVVSEATYTAVGGTVRLSGDSRQGTATQVADDAIKNEGFLKASVGLVGNLDRNAADALVAAPLAGTNKTPLLFIDAGITGAPTATYLKAHAADLTGTGYVFGGLTAVPQADVDLATAAAVGVSVSVQGYVVTAVPTGSSTAFSYADPASQAAKKVTTKSTDKFTVSGSAATQGAFIAALQVGGTVSVVSAADGTNTYAYTPLSSTGYSTGLVGAYVVGSHTLSVVEPITGTVLPFLGTSATAWDYTSGGSAYVVYTVDGQSVSQGIFEGALSLGDTVTVTGTGADVSHIRTVALTSGSLVGTVAAVTPGTSTNAGAVTAFTVKTAAGATLTQSVTPASGDTVSIDGTSSTEATLVGSGLAGSSTASPISIGDQVTYSKTGGIQKFALVNSAPSKISGVVTDASNVTGITWWSPSGTPNTQAYAGISRFIIDGTIASQADFVAAVTPGDLVTYQAADTTTSTTSSLTLISKPLTGSIGTANSSNHTVSLNDADGDAVTTGTRYDLATSVFTAGTGSVVYTIDGTTSTLAQFDAMVGRIQSGARQGAVQVSINNGSVTWALATTVFSAAPAITSGSYVSKAATLTISFNKPVNNATPANADWNITIGGTSATLSSAVPPAWDPTNTKLTFTLTGAGSPGSQVVVTPASSTLAAHYLDTYGTALGTSSFSFSAS